MSASPKPSPSRHISSRKTPAQRHHELLEAAVAIGATEGLGAVTLARVAAAAKVSSGLVHHYFSGAAEMVNATFRHTANHAWLTFLADIVTAGTHTGEFHVTHPHTTARRLLTIIDGLGAQTSTPTPLEPDSQATEKNDPQYVRTYTAPHGLRPTELKGIATDFARHELGLT